MPMTYKRILICGGRDFEDHEMFKTAMHYIAERYLEHTLLGGLLDVTVISGGATGADQRAIEWAIGENVAYREFKADWNKHGKRAGYLRNKQMLEEGKPDLVIAFPGGKGTTMMIDLAAKAKVKVLKVSRTDPDNIFINEISQKTTELQTEKYKQIYLDRVLAVHTKLTPGVKMAIFLELIEEEKSWLANMDKDYNDIMEAQDAFDKTQS